MNDNQPNEKVTVLGSDGIHTRIHTQPLNEDGTKKEWDGPPENLFWGHIESLMQESKQTLLASEFPDPMQVVKYVVGLGWLHDDHAPKSDREKRLAFVADRNPKEGKRIWEEMGKPAYGNLRGDSYAMEVAETFTEEWYAGQIHHLCALVSDNQKSSYAGHLVRIYQIVEFEKDREWRRDFSLMIKRDIKGQEARSAGGHAKKANFARRTVQILMSMNEMKSKGIPVFRAAELTFKNGLGTSQGANQKLWTRKKHIFNKQK